LLTGFALEGFYELTLRVERGDECRTNEVPPLREMSRFKGSFLAV